MGMQQGEMAKVSPPAEPPLDAICFCKDKVLMVRHALLPSLRLDLTSMSATEWDIALDMVAIDAFIHAVTHAVLGSQVSDALVDRLRLIAEGADARNRIVAALMHSAEFRARYGRRALASMPLEAFIRQTYRDVLGRSPDSGGMETYLRMGLKWRGRRRVVNAIRNSPEGMQAEGGALGRIAALKRRAWQWWVARVPLIGWRIAASGENDRRLKRLEVLMAAQLYVPEPGATASELVRQVAERLPSPTAWHGEPEFAALPADASPEEQKMWRFQDAVIRARRTQTSGFSA